MTEEKKNERGDAGYALWNQISDVCRQKERVCGSAKRDRRRRHVTDRAKHAVEREIRKYKKTVRVYECVSNGDSYHRL